MSRRWGRPGVLLAAAAVALGGLDPAPAQGQAEGEGARFDVVLRGGRVLDGTGNPWYRADVGIVGDRIVAVGDLADARAARILDVEGRTIVPGFIDLHSHAEEGLAEEGGSGSEGARRRSAPNLVSQGITTVVINQDGRSPWPIGDQRARLERLGFGPNAALMIGHNAIRALALGDDAERVATPEEIERMRAMVERGMAEGAYGLSAGLEYEPGRWSETSELVPLVAEAGRAGGVFIVHERSSGMTPMWFWPSRHDPGPPTMIQTILEDIEIAETTGVTTVATHIKARGSDFWGAGRALIDLIERARARGVPIWADQYPYNTTGSDGSTVLIPGWLIREALREERANGERPDFAAAWDAYPVEVAIRLQLEGDRRRPGGARVRGFSLSEIDVEAFAAEPWVATASDAGIALPGDPPVHARYYGTFPRKIRRYAMERGVVSIESAGRSATSLPAQILGLADRGLIREGLAADIAVLDLAELRDEATFFEPHRYPRGVEFVLVNGRFVVDGGELTGALPGRILTPGAVRAAAGSATSGR